MGINEVDATTAWEQIHSEPGYHDPATCRADVVLARVTWAKMKRSRKQAIIYELRKTMHISDIAQLLSVKPQSLYDCIR